MFTRTKFVFSVAIMLGSAGAAQAGFQSATLRQAQPTIQRQAPSNPYESYRSAQAPDQNAHMPAVYFGPIRAPFKAFTYCASVQLGPSISKRGLSGEFRFPAFSASPNVSVQIISTLAATPMHVIALEIAEITGISEEVETQIVVEAETIFDVPANGIFYANVVVTGVPVSPSPSAKAAQL